MKKYICVREANYILKNNNMIHISRGDFFEWQASDNRYCFSKDKRAILYDYEIRNYKVNFKLFNK